MNDVTDGEVLGNFLEYFALWNNIQKNHSWFMFMVFWEKRKISGMWSHVLLFHTSHISLDNKSNRYTIQKTGKNAEPS